MTRGWPARLLLAYPPGWRARYGDEVDLLVSELCEDGRRPVPMAIDLIGGAAAAWCGIRRGFAMSERSRNALITVLWSWVAFAATAAWFGHDLGIYPSRSAAPLIARAHPAVPDAYHVLLAAGIVGLAATAIAAGAFAVEAARAAGAERRYRTLALMAVPPVVAGVWLGGIQLLGTGSDTTTRMTLAVSWLLLGLAGIAAATQTVAKIVRTTDFKPATWRIGSAAAAAVTAAMLVGTGATITWGLAFRAAQGHNPGDSWLIVTAILAVTTGRAAIALIASRRAASPEAVTA
jgi:hypothetical protein